MLSLQIISLIDCTDQEMKNFLSEKRLLWLENVINLLSHMWILIAMFQQHFM